MELSRAWGPPPRPDSPSILIKGVAAPVPFQLLCVHNYHRVAGFLGGRDGDVEEE